MCACTMTEHLCERGEKSGCLMFPEHATVSVQRAKRIFQVLLLIFLHMCHKDSEVHDGRDPVPYLLHTSPTEGTRKTFNIQYQHKTLWLYIAKPPCLIYAILRHALPTTESNKQTNKQTNKHNSGPKPSFNRACDHISVYNQSVNQITPLCKFMQLDLTLN